MNRANYLPAPHAFNLNMACVHVNEALGDFGCYLVGSSLEKRDYRDVDIRYIMADDRYKRMFPGLLESGMGPGLHPFWSLLCVSISMYLSQHTGLPIDFQIQPQSKANEEYGGRPRLAQGLFPNVKRFEEKESEDKPEVSGVHVDDPEAEV